MLAPRHFRYVKDDLDGFTNREFRVAMMELQGRNLVVAVNDAAVEVVYV
jgi:hypothetical protein